MDVVLLHVFGHRDHRTGVARRLTIYDPFTLALIDKSYFSDWCFGLVMLSRLAPDRKRLHASLNINSSPGELLLPRPVGRPGEGETGKAGGARPRDETVTGRLQLTHEEEQPRNASKHKFGCGTSPAAPYLRPSCAHQLSVDHIDEWKHGRNLHECIDERPVGRR